MPGGLVLLRGGGRWWEVADLVLVCGVTVVAVAAVGDPGGSRGVAARHTLWQALRLVVGGPHLLEVVQHVV